MPAKMSGIIRGKMLQRGCNELLHRVKDRSCVLDNNADKEGHQTFLLGNCSRNDGNICPQVDVHQNTEYTR